MFLLPFASIGDALLWVDDVRPTGPCEVRIGFNWSEGEGKYGSLPYAYDPQRAN